MRLYSGADRCRKQYSSEEPLLPSQRLQAAYGLVALGARDEDLLLYLIASVETAPTNQSKNLVSALATVEDRDRVTSILRDRIAPASASLSEWRTNKDPGKKEAPNLKVRLVATLLALGEKGDCLDMLKTAKDPIERTIFIDQFYRSPGDPSVLPDLLNDEPNTDFRSGLCLALGKTPYESFRPQDAEALSRLLKDWYVKSHEAPVHSAAGWALRQWKLEVPEIALSERPGEGREWHVNGVDLTMVKIPTGSFVRKVGDDNNPIEQTVKLTRSFLLADREVTRAQFQQFIDDADYPDAEKPREWKGAEERISPTKQHPVQNVSWYDAVLFCNWLSWKDHIPEEQRCYTISAKGTVTAKTDHWNLSGYRLPCEAEWEYACRAGTESAYGYGDQESLLDQYAVYNTGQTELTATKLPNGWGLFDLHGNVWEWCQDGYEPYNRDASVRDPLGDVQSDRRVLRGGSFFDKATVVRSAYRSNLLPGSRVSFSGFRLARTYP